MIGPVLVLVAIVIAIPVGVLMSGAAASAILGFFLRDDAEDRYQGSELIDLNR
ncbi:MAG: hypothetical protein QOI20_2369 [Acidimicrobiaceae bacterium]|nr:hypothetical protein [Acidimicrobiaceae bacterium]